MITLYNQNVWNHNPSEYRNGLIRTLVSQYDADICTFQECGPTTTRAGKAPLPELLKDAYQEVCPEMADKNFTPVFFKKEKFLLENSGYFLYDGFNDANSKSVTWAILKEKSTSFIFAVISTHFWWKFHSPVDFTQRISNAEQLKAKCDEIVQKYNVPIIIGGDFNNGKDSIQGDEPYKLMLSYGFNDIRLSADKKTDVYTHHGYPILGENDMYMPSADFDCIIDFIFTYGKNIPKAEKFDIITTDSSLASSDHCPLIGYFSTEGI